MSVVGRWYDNIWTFRKMLLGFLVIGHQPSSQMYFQDQLLSWLWDRKPGGSMSQGLPVIGCLSSLLPCWWWLERTMISSPSLSWFLVPRSFQHIQLLSAWRTRKSAPLVPASSSPQRGIKILSLVEGQTHWWVIPTKNVYHFGLYSSLLLSPKTHILIIKP